MTVNRVLADRSGYIWIATENGLARYDGHQYQVWTQNEGLPDNEVLLLEEDNHGRIWAATLQDYVFLEDGKVVTRKEAPWIPDLPGLPWTMEKMVDGKMCIGSKYGMLAFNEQGCDTVYWGESRLRYRLVYEGKDLGIAPVSDGGTLFCEVTGQQGPALEVVLPGLPEGWNRYALGEFRGRVSEKAIRYLQRNATYLTDLYQGFMDYCDNCAILSIFIEPDSTVWAATPANGMLVYRPEEQEILHFLDESTIHGIEKDMGGNKWIYTMGAGIFVLPYGKSEVLSYYPGGRLLSNPVVTLEGGTNGEVFLGYGRGQVGVRFPNQQIVHHVRTEGYDTNKKIREMKQLANGDLFCGSDQGVFFIGNPGKLPGNTEGGRNGMQEQGQIVPGKYPMLRSYATKGLTVLSDSFFCIATSEGSYRLKRVENGLEREKFLNFRAYAFEYDPRLGKFWVGGVDSLFLCDMEGKCEAAPFGNASRHLITEVALGEDGKVWASTMGAGVYCWDGKKVQQFTSAEGLMSDLTTSLFLVGSDTVWIGSDLGLTCLVDATTQPRFLHYTTAFGLAGNYVTDVVQVGREVWVATPEGVSYFDPRQPKLVLPIPKIDFSGVNIRGRDTLVLPRYQLAEWQNSLTIRFRDSLFQAVKYQYRISGEQDDWEELSSAEVHFPLLEAGKVYDLEVRAANRDGRWSGTRTLEFDIRLPFYKRTWFALLVLTLLVGIPVSVLWWRRRSQEAIRQTREEFSRQLAQSRLMALKSQMNPHFLFNSLNSIQHLVTENDTRTTSKYVSKFARLMRRVLDNSHSEFISLAEEISVCQLYIDLEAMRLMHNFKHELVLDPALDPEALRVPGMMLQPFIENAIWHGLMPKAEDRHLRWEIRREGRQLLCIVEDNGVGRSQNEAPVSGREGHLSRAVTNFEERLALFNRAFDTTAFSLRYIDLQSEDGTATGTRVEILCPFLHDLDVEKQTPYA